MLCHIHTAIRADLPCWAPVRSTYPAVPLPYALTYPAGPPYLPRRALLYALTYPAGHTCTYPAVAFLYALTYPAGHTGTYPAVRANLAGMHAKIYEVLNARLWADFSSFVPLRNAREGARDFGNENFHCGSFLVRPPSSTHTRVFPPQLVLLVNRVLLGLSCSEALP
jgi:hypothetical protein